MNKNIVLGLDFGTTTTLIAKPGDSWPEVLQLGESETWMPSAISTRDGISWLVGENAENAALEEQFLSPKSLITFDEESISNQLGITITREKAITLILSEVKNRIEKKYPGLLGSGQIRISCPAIWTGPQRFLLARLATECGLVADVDEILDEPISAGIAWWWDKNIKNKKKAEGKTLVFDLGGGTLDVAVLDVYNHEDRQPQFTVLSARGTAIAGDKVDKAFADYVEDRLVNEEGYVLPIGQDLLYLRAVLRRSSKEAKEKLSRFPTIKFEVDKKYADLPSFTISRVDFESKIFNPVLQSALSCVQAALKEAAHKKEGADLEKIKRMDISEISSQINHVILAGGMSQIPCIEVALNQLMPNAGIDYVTTKSEANEGIVLGIANSNDFENLNIHRPGFNFILKWKERNGKSGEKIMYGAFTPLYTETDILLGKTELGFSSEIWIPDFDPANNIVELCITSVGGRRVSLKSSENKSGTSMQLQAFKNSKIDFKIYINGRIIIEDAAGQETYRVKEWPYIRWGNFSKVEPEFIIEKKSWIPRNEEGSEGWRE